MGLSYPRIPEMHVGHLTSDSSIPQPFIQGPYYYTILNPYFLLPPWESVLPNQQKNPLLVRTHSCCCCWFPKRTSDANTNIRARVAEKKSASERKETYADAAKHGLEQDTATEGVKVAASDAAKVAASDVSKLAEAAKA